MEELRYIIAKNITKLRIANKLTQIDLAEKLNYSDKAVSKWERGESLPDIIVLKQIADIFGVSLDFLVDKSSKPDKENKVVLRGIKNHGFITGMSILLVWLIATFLFVVIQLSYKETSLNWLSFVYAVPISMIVWLVFNSIWFNTRRNYIIISLLMWTVLATLFITFLMFDRNIWLIFLLGIPGQFIIFMWSKLKYHSEK